MAGSYQFGTQFTAHMVTATWSRAKGWGAPELTERRPIPLDPTAVGLHYGQSVFEGLKAHRQPDGHISIFRPHAHASRMRQSAARLAMPEPPVDLFVEALEMFVRADGDALPDDPSLSLYVRPLLIATESTLALRPADEFLFVVLGFVTKAFFTGGMNPVSVWVSPDFARAMPGGTGAAKYTGNYAPTFAAQTQAAENGCDQVVWLDAVERRWVEELGGMNLFFVHRDRITTPPLTGTLLPGVTRDCLLQLAPGLGYAVAEEPIAIDEWRAGCHDGSIVETLACGTAAIVTPIGAVKTASESWTVGDGTTGPVAKALYDALQAVQQGRAEDPFGWRYPVRNS
ncbi:branched-chain amino acid aminotransferase [Kibdelosporangium philippinense]|uniref:Branched-chain-amino-acid aminotransferase n=1 Tax=Kibdelosporangium philippinense TaxID=211113 RepID=A0ABS8ZUT0_9PSEU|nr:branched-chain amino acid aminotransferase [Kibdelosporangium philippinense]